MAVGQHKRAVGVFANRHDAETAIGELKSAGFPMHKVTIIAQDADRKADVAGVNVQDKNQAGNKADEGATAGALTGGTLGGITGLLVGLGALAIPGVGPIMVAGELATVLTTTVAGGAIGAAAGGLVGALIGLGIPEERAQVYSDRVDRGDYLVIVKGSDEEIARAEAILNHRGIEEYGVYDARDVDTTPSATPMGSSYTDTTADYTPAATGMPVGYTAGYMPGMTPTADYAPGTVAPGTVTPAADRSLYRRKRAVGAFTSRHDAETALNQLRESGFPMDNVNVVSKNADRIDNIAGADVKKNVGNKADEGAAAGALTGGAIGGIGGLLVGLGALAIPGIGPVMLAGATATTIATALSGGAIGAAAGGLAGALVGLGIPEERAKVYNDRLSQGDYLIFVDGTEDEIRRAESVLHHRGIQEWGIYDAPDADTPRRSEYAATDTRDTVRGGDVIESEARRTNYDSGVVDPNDPKVIIVDKRDSTL
ncbi:general stress protein [Scytonema millei]|uniref:Histidine kinase n=1 Tax=Scytonema millei VB511283 TaxID=1245923 RepID=A0A9X5E5J9_9CYAN|nr:general stress protein [Scytonema millei]NHC35391.1 histidine kinase [Scytonema millei VB511283]